MYHKLVPATIILFILQFGQIRAQSKGMLVENVLVSSELAPGERHQYKVKLGKDQFAFFRLMQKGVDILVTTYDGKGEKIEDFDSPNGQHGLELFTLTSSDAAEYMIEVAPFSKDEPRGKYELRLEKIGQAARTPNERVDQLFTVWNDDQSPGAAVAIVKDGALIYKKGYGMANLEYEIPITPASVFHVASVSKQFTVFSVLLLEKQGKLSLDDDIRKYLPEVPDFGKVITLRHLACHTSGLRDQWDLLVMAGWRMDDVITKDHILKMVSRQKELNFNPGDEFSYCNTGFTLLAEVVARLSKRSFAEFTKDNIFKPLKMNSTLFYDDHEKIVKQRAYSYKTDSSGYKKSVLNFANAGATSLFTTAEDLHLWALNFAAPVVGDADIISNMNTPAKLNNGKSFGGALGQFVGNYKGLNEIQHGGADAGYRSFLTRFPDEKFSVIVLSNAAEFNTGSMAHKIVDIYLSDKLKAESRKEAELKATHTKELIIDPKILNSYVGDYELQPGMVFSIAARDGRLFAQPPGGPMDALRPVSETQFKMTSADVTLTFVTSDDGKTEMLKVKHGDQTDDATKLKPFDKTSVKLADFTGKFHSEELATEYDITQVGKQLIMKHSRVSDIQLNPERKDTFSSYLGNIEFVRDAKNAITGFKLSSGRVRNLKFKKVAG